MASGMLKDENALGGAPNSHAVARDLFPRGNYSLLQGNESHPTAQLRPPLDPTPENASSKRIGRPESPEL